MEPEQISLSGTSWDSNMNDLIRQFLGDNPTAALYYTFPQVRGTSPLGDFIRGSQSRLYGSYLSELPNNPNMLFQDFLQTQDPEAQFNALAPQQRGENPSRFAPPVRFLPRKF